MGIPHDFPSMGRDSSVWGVLWPTHASWTETWAVVCGIGMQAVLWVTVVGSVLAAESFDWPTDPISIVGAGDGPLALAFNAGLVVTGVLAVPFAVWLGTDRRILGVLYGLVGVSFLAGGLFPLPNALHDLASGIFVFTWVLCWADAAAGWRGDDRWRAAVSVALGATALAIWLPYDLGIESAQIGVGAVEGVAFAVLTVWTVLAVRRGYRRS